MGTSKLVESGRFTLVRDEHGHLLWHGGNVNEESVYLEELSLHPNNWPLGTAITVYEPDNIPIEEQKRVFGAGVEIVSGGET